MKKKTHPINIGLIISIIAIFFNSLPAGVIDINGIWTAEFNSQIGTQKYIFKFEQTDTLISAAAEAYLNEEKREVIFTDVKLDSNQISFKEMMSYQGMEFPIVYSGSVSESEMKLTRQVGDFASLNIVALRQKK